MNDVLAAIGEALIDFIPDKSGCGFGEVSAFSPKIGGAPANVCAAFSKLGGRSRMITQLGDDPFGHKIIDELNAADVDTSCITLTDKANTALAFVSLDKDGGRTFSFYRKPSADMLLDEDGIKDDHFDDVFALHFCSVDIGDFPMKRAHIKAIDTVRRKGGVISFDPNLRFALWDSREALRSAVSEFIPLSDIVKISDEELEFVTGYDDADTGIKAIIAEGVKLVLYTCGSRGAYAFTENAKVYASSIYVKAVDTTGAGDGFAGAFLWKLKTMSSGDDLLAQLTEDKLKECLEFANRFCALSVQRKGAIASYPTLEEIPEI